MGPRNNFHSKDRKLTFLKKNADSIMVMGLDLGPLREIERRAKQT